MKKALLITGLTFGLFLVFSGSAHADWTQPASSTLSTNVGMPPGTNIASGTVSFAMTITGLKMRFSASSTSHVYANLVATRSATTTCNDGYLDPDVYNLAFTYSPDYGGTDQNPIIYDEPLLNWQYHGVSYTAGTDGYPTIPVGYTWCIEANGDYFINNLRAYGTTVESPGAQYLVSSLSGLAYPYYSFKGIYDPRFISLTVPTSGANENFGLWQGTYTLNTTDNEDNLFVRIRYGNSTSTFSYADIEPVSGGSFSINRLTDLATSTTWYAYATLLQNSVTLATSSIVSFTVAGGEMVFPTVSSTPPQLPAIDCSQYGEVGGAFCRIFRALFAPSADAISQFENISFSNRVPFAYVGMIQTAWQTLSSSTPAAVDIGTVPTDGGVLDTMRNIFIVIFWVLFLTYAFQRLHKVNV